MQFVFLLIRKKKGAARAICFLANYAPINVNPVGWGGEGGGVRTRGGDLTNFGIFGSNSPGWETKGRSKVSKRPPPHSL